ncbi:MAG: A/G-specific adenine glycosylase [Candidatus Omnitrophica bacterium]|nr:A/G-specific adenine glycosylase [Candidatus Omnitrophota bacterium]
MMQTEIHRRRQFTRRLLAWYARHKRDLPWRRTKDPYKILVSEIMLHQTQVDRVAPKFEEFVARYPTVHDLAKANLKTLKKEWYPLGYNYRPARLRSIAREAVARYDGRVPERYDELIAMDGVGEYTAGAILSIAYNQSVPALDTNVIRVLRRVFGVRGDPAQRTTQKRLTKLAASLIPQGRAGDFNEAMMDLGAMVCTAKRPACPTCCLRRLCRSYPLTNTGACGDAS